MLVWKYTGIYGIKEAEKAYKWLMQASLFKRPFRLWCSNIDIPHPKKAYLNGLRIDCSQYLIIRNICIHILIRKIIKALYGNLNCSFWLSLICFYCKNVVYIYGDKVSVRVSYFYKFRHND